MKYFLVACLVLVSAVAARADGDFTKTMTPEEITETGLSKLSPEELARLKAIIERYRSGEVAVVEKKAEAQVAAVKHEAEQKVIATKQEADKQVATVRQQADNQVATVKQEAETKVAAAETRAKEAETKAKTEKPATAEDAKKKEKSPSWMTALITLKRTEEKPDKVEAYETRIAGEFTGWRGKTTFRLENGQIWQQVDGADYVGVKFDSPKVSIKPGVLGTFWMKVEGVHPRVKVKPIKLE